MKIDFSNLKSWKSIRKYLDKQVCDDIIRDLLKAGKEKIDLVGDKLISFTVIQDKEKLEILNNKTKKDMVEKSTVDIISRLGKTPDFDMFNGASTVIMISIKDKSKIFVDIIGEVIHKIVTEAKELGLAAHWNSFVKYHFKDSGDHEILEELSVPENYTPYYVISVGYPK